MPKIIKNINTILANTYSLYLKTQNYHWCVTGPYFAQLHTLFENQYEELVEAVDTIAERIRATGSMPLAGFEDFIKARTLKDGDSTNNWQLMIQDLIADHKTILANLYEVIKICEQKGDEATLDLIVERIRSHEKTSWMLKAHLD